MQGGSVNEELAAAVSSSGNPQKQGPSKLQRDYAAVLLQAQQARGTEQCCTLTGTQLHTEQGQH